MWVPGLGLGRCSSQPGCNLLGVLCQHGCLLCMLCMLCLLRFPCCLLCLLSMLGFWAQLAARPGPGHRVLEVGLHLPGHCGHGGAGQRKAARSKAAVSGGGRRHSQRRGGRREEGCPSPWGQLGGAARGQVED